MTRPGNHIFLWILATYFVIETLHPPGLVIVAAAFAVGWYYNEKERPRDA